MPCVIGIPQLVDLSSLLQRDVRTPSVVAGRCGLVSISLLGRRCGK